MRDDILIAIVATCLCYALFTTLGAITEKDRVGRILLLIPSWMFIAMATIGFLAYVGQQ